MGLGRCALGLLVCFAACGPVPSTRDSGFVRVDAGPPPFVDAGTPCRAREVCEPGLTCVPKNALMFANGHPCKEACSCDNGKLTCTLVCAPTNVTCPPLPVSGDTCIGGQICQIATGAGEIIQCTCNGKPDAGPREPWFCF